ncbi:MAG: rhodanese-like domain-containing protein [Verrucomicrobia bacterium]|nr:rhodanese-like domain-containing protein [Verrucomicrobiota bacterium]
MHRLVPFSLALLAACLASLSGQTTPPPNPDIDYAGFLANAARLESLRESRRVSTTEFLRLAAEPGTIVLDARSAAAYRAVHVKGAINLSLPDFTAERLARLIPSKSTRILIYCNNNFRGAPDALASKLPVTSLNIYTFNSLVGYGYTNVFELGPLEDYRKTSLPLAGDNVGR